MIMTAQCCMAREAHNLSAGCYHDGITINSSLTWNDHIEDLVKKAFHKLYFLVQLKRAQISPKDLVAYYCACNRSTLDYACPLFHHALPKYLQLDLDRVQKRALSKRLPLTTVLLLFVGLLRNFVSHRAISMGTCPITVSPLNSFS